MMEEAGGEGEGEEMTPEEAEATHAEVVGELWETIQALEEERDGLADKTETLLNALINAQEDGQAYREQYEKIHSEGQALYASYQTKCERLKAVNAELDKAKASASDLQAELGTAREAFFAAEAAKADALFAKADAEAAQAAAEAAAQEARSVEMPGASAASTDLSASELQGKLESASISNELLRNEVERQRAAAQLAARSAAQREEAVQEQLRSAEAAKNEAVNSAEAMVAIAQAEAEQVTARAAATQAQLQGKIEALMREAADAKEEAAKMTGVKQEAEATSAAMAELTAQRDAAEASAAAARKSSEEQSAEVKRLEADLRLLYHRSKDELALANSRYDGAAARCALLSVRCAKQQEAIQEVGVWQAECGRLHALLTENANTIASLGDVSVTELIEAQAAAQKANQPPPYVPTWDWVDESSSAEDATDEEEAEAAAKHAQTASQLESATTEVSSLKAELRSVREMEIAAREEASLVGKALASSRQQAEAAAAEADVASLLSEIIGHVAGHAEAKEEARKVMMAEAAEGEGQVARLESELQRVTEMSEFQQAEAEAALADVKSLQAAAEEAAKEATETLRQREEELAAANEQCASLKSTSEDLAEQLSDAKMAAEAERRSRPICTRAR